MTISHGKQITSKSYYEGNIVSETEEIETQQFTDKQYLLKDIINGLLVITSGETRKLIIEVSLDKQGRYKLTQRWRVQ